MTTESFSARWELFTTLPAKNGRYAVCHRGRHFGNAYFMNGKWIQKPTFQPTHWLNGGYDKLAKVGFGTPRIEEQLNYEIDTVY